MDKIRSFFLRCRGNPDTATHLDVARQQYADLLAYVGRLEYDGCYDIESLERLYGRPEWLRSV